MAENARLLLSVVGFFIFFPKVFYSGGSVVAVTDNAEIFEHDSYYKPDAGKKDSDAAEYCTEKRHVFLFYVGIQKPFQGMAFYRILLLLHRV